MKDYKDYKLKLVLRDQGLLNSKEEKELDEHLKVCEKCKNIHLDIDKIIKRPVTAIPADHLSSILEKAKKIEKKEKVFTLYKFLVFQNILINMKRNIKILTPIFVIGLIAFFSIFMLKDSIFNKDHLYIVKAFGEVEINNKSLDSIDDFKYKLKNVEININKGECLLQMNNNKLLLLKENTHVIVNKSKEISVNFINGFMIGKTIKSKYQKRFVIKSDENNFRIAGTIFSIKKDSNITDFAVSKGVVEYQNIKEIIPLTKDQRALIKKDSYKIVNITKEEKKVFDQIKTYPLMDNFRDINKIKIKTSPINSNIYLKDKLFGKTPAFFIVDEDFNDNFTIKKEGYLSEKYDTVLESYDEVLYLKKLGKNNINSYHKISKSEVIEITNASGLRKVDKKGGKASLMYDSEFEVIEITNASWLCKVDKKGSKASILYDSELNGKRCTICEYDFGSGDWVRLYKNIDADVSEMKYITFNYNKTNPLKNKVEIGITDKDGSFFGEVIYVKPFSDSWQTTNISLDRLNYLGGGDPKLDKHRLKSISILLGKIEGGSGKIGIIDVSFKK